MKGVSFDIRLFGEVAKAVHEAAIRSPTAPDAVRAMAIAPWLTSMPIATFEHAAREEAKTTLFLRLIPSVHYRDGKVSGLASSLAAIVQLAIVWRGLSVLRPADGEGDVSVNARDVLRVGWPIALTFLAEVGAFTIAGLLAGRIGPSATAGHQVAITIASVTFCVSLGISAATTVRVGRAVGRGDAPGARRAGFVGLGTSLGYMALCAVGFAVFAGPIARVLSDRPEVLASAIPLVQIAAFFQLSDGLQCTAAGALRGIGDTRFIQWVNIFGHYVVGLPLAVALAFGAHLAERGLWWGLSAGLTAVAIPLVWRFHVKSRGPLARLA